MARKKRGQSMIEVMIGLVVIIPIGLAAVDIVTLTNASQNNEELCETASRAAATKGDQQGATKAVQEIIDRVQLNSVIQQVSIQNVTYDLGTGKVTVGLVMTVKVPVPFPYLNTVDCQAISAQPIVSTPAPQ